MGKERYTPEFKAHLLRRWVNEGNHEHTFEKKIWRWLTAPRPTEFRSDQRAEQRHFRAVDNWAHNQTMNSEESGRHTRG